MTRLRPLDYIFDRLGLTNCQKFAQYERSQVQIPTAAKNMLHLVYPKVNHKETWHECLFCKFSWITYLSWSPSISFIIRRVLICCLHSFSLDPISHHIFSCIISCHRLPHRISFVNCWRKWKICKWGLWHVHFSDNFAFFFFSHPSSFPLLNTALPAWPHTVKKI